MNNTEHTPTYKQMHNFLKNNVSHNRIGKFLKSNDMKFLKSKTSL